MTKVKAEYSAKSLIRQPLGLIETILLRHEQAHLEVLFEEHQKYNDLVDRILAGTEHIHIDDWLKEQGK